MKKKTKTVIRFLNGMHEFITKNPQFRKDTKTKSETAIQTELRPLIILYLEKYFKEAGYVDYVGKANKSFYWEGQEGKFGKEKNTLFGSRNYPDFVVTEPYLLAIEYKQSQYGSTVKQGIGQSIMHTLGGEFDFVYLLFHDQNKDKRIEKSITNQRESMVLERTWNDYNVSVRFI